MAPPRLIVSVARALKWRCGMQRLAIGEHDLQQTAGWPAIFNRLHSDRHFVARLERSLAPTAVNHVGRIARLRNPMRDIAAFILDVITQEAVRIGPKPSRDCTLHYDRFPAFKGRGTMVCG